VTELRDHLQTSLGATYRIERELGGGGMSRVFVAEESSLGRQVVVKVLPSDPSSSLSIERFKREIGLVAGLQHPHIVPLLTAGEIGGVPYFTMPLVDGETLRARLNRGGELPITDAIRLLRDVASALAYAHRKGIVHRDIKPENILLADEHAIVSDFGVAKALTAATAGDDSRRGLTSVGIALGTPAYMAPEQAAGDPSTDHRADIYAFGVVAYEVLTGRPPFEGRPQALIAAHATEDPRQVSMLRPKIPRALASLVMQCLAKRPADRPQRADDLIRELDGATLSWGERAAPLEQRSRSRWAIVAAWLLVVAGSFAGYAAWRYRRETPPAPGRPSIAVMPTAHTGGDSADEAFTDGLAEELISSLSTVEALDVKASTSVFALKGKDLTAAQLGDTLGVANILESSMVRFGDRIRVTTRLVNVVDNRVIWAKTFSRDSRDMFAVQEEIAQAVVSALSVRLNASGDRLVHHGTADVGAYSLFVQGKFYRGLLTPDGLRQSISFFRQAIDRDTNFAEAYAWLGSAHTLLAVFGAEPASTELPEARRWVAAALRKDSALADAHWMMGEILANQDHDQRGAEKEFHRALELDPGSTHVRFFVGMGTIPLSSDSALVELHRGLAVDPLSSELLMAAGLAFRYGGNLDSAAWYLRRALVYTPSFTFARQNLAHVYLLQQRRQQAIAEFEEAARLGGARDSAQLAYGYAISSRRADAERILRALVASGNKRYLAPVTMAMAYTGLGNKAEALRWLASAEKDNDPLLVLIADASFDPLRADPRHAAFMARLQASRAPKWR
jgi:serine/threonine-protein kinase